MYVNQKSLLTLIDATLYVYNEVKSKIDEIDEKNKSNSYFTPFVESILQTIHQISQKCIKVEKAKDWLNFYKWSLRENFTQLDIKNKMVSDLFEFKGAVKKADLYEILSIDIHQNHTVEISEDHTLKWTWKAFERNGFLWIHMYALLDHLEISLLDNLNLVRDTWLKQVPTVKDLSYKCKTFMRFYTIP